MKQNETRVRGIKRSVSFLVFKWFPVGFHERTTENTDETEDSAEYWLWINRLPPEVVVREILTPGLGGIDIQERYSAVEFERGICGTPEAVVVTSRRGDRDRYFIFSYAGYDGDPPVCLRANKQPATERDTGER